MDPDEEDAHDLQATHSTTTANSVYGIRGDILRSLSSRSISIFRRVTERWHVFLGLISEEDVGATSKLPKSSLSMPMPPAKRRGVDRGDLESRVEEGLIKLVGPEGKFKSEEQREGLRGVMRGDDPLVVVLNTGGGKSLLFMAPALLKGSRTTIVVVPFVALAEDMMKRCKEAGLSCIKWKMGPRYGAQIVIVAAETATTKESRQYAWSLHVDGRLDRIVMDECHIVLESRRSRRSLVNSST
jgi:DEAD/DEAH box helicase